MIQVWRLIYETEKILFMSGTQLRVKPDGLPHAIGSQECWLGNTGS